MLWFKKFFQLFSTLAKNLWEKKNQYAILWSQNARGDVDEYES